MIVWKFTTSVLVIFANVFWISCEGKSSLTFVVDRTYSMRDDINQVIEAATDIMDIVHKKQSSQIENVILVTFDDPGYDLVVKAEDRLELQRKLYAIELFGNYDCPEMSLSGTRLGLQESLSGSYMYVFTDDDPKDYHLVDEVKNLAQKKQNQVIFVITPNDNCEPWKKSFKEYYKIAAATSGQVFRLTKKSDVKSVLTYVEETISGQRTLVTSKIIPPNEWAEINFVIDDKTEYGIVSTSGENVDLILKKSPAGHKKLTWLQNVKIIRLETSGDYTIRVKGSGTTSVMVFGRTDFTFKHGFSGFKPKSLDHTSAQPISGQKSFLSIKLIDKQGDVEVTTVKILDMDEHVLIEKPLEAIDKKLKLYVTEPFEPPTTIFKIAIVGYGIYTNKSIVRTSQTPVEPQDPTVGNPKNISPSIEIEEGSHIEADYDKPLQLKCKVIAYPMPTITWMDEMSGNIMESKTIPIEINYEYVSLLDVENVNETHKYTCKARNLFGEDMKHVTVDIKNYFNVLESPTDTAVEYQKSGKLICKVAALPPATITWYKNDEKLNSNDHISISRDGFTLTIDKMQIETEGDYMCEARNDFQRSFLHAYVSVSGLEPPQIQKAIRNIRIKEGSSASLDCRILKGVPKPAIRWFYNNDLMITNNTSQESIVLTSVHRDRSGVYKCEAKNLKGIDSHDTLVEVECSPSIKENANVTSVKSGTQVVLNCKVDGVPVPDVTWAFEGKPINDSRKFINPNYSLSFEATLKDIGDFTCEAKNKHGTATKVTAVDVFVPAIINSKSDIHKVLLGKNVTLPCDKYGYPKPEIKWIYLSKDHETPSKTLLTKNEILTLSKIKTAQSGFYTCVATNYGGSANVTHEVIVESPPEIINVLSSTTIRAVIGDVSLSIPCYTTGNPKPTVTWLQEGLPFVLDEFSYLEEDGTLIIGNVDKNVEGDYVCIAENAWGIRYQTNFVVVDDFPKPGYPTTKVQVEQGKPTELECNVPHFDTDQISWYKNGNYQKGRKLILKNPKKGDTGTYTCRVSNMKKSTNGYLSVVVGYKPKFLENQDGYIDFEKGYFSQLDCSADGDPKPQISWWHNGVLLNYDEDTYYVGFNINDRGEYVCVAENEFGNVSKRFIVESNDCVLNPNTDFNTLTPIMLTIDSEWPTFEKDEGNIRIPTGENILLHCPRGFSDSNTTEHIISCEKETNFELAGKTINFRELTCKEESKPIVKRAGRRCLSFYTEQLQMGYEIQGKFLEVYEVCFNKNKKIAEYAKHEMQHILSENVPSNKEWFDHELLSLDFKTMFTCSKQFESIHSIQLKWSHRRDNCCFSKRQLVSPRDVFPGLLQMSTYSKLNVIPHWGTCNEQNWDDVESRIRLLATNIEHNLEVWTGVADQLQLEDPHGKSRKEQIRDGISGHKQPIPLYIWKVVRNPVNRKSLAIIQVNVPDLKFDDASKYVLCEDICSKVTWMNSTGWHDTSRGYTYCCHIQDFSKSFSLNVFGSDNDAVLYNIPYTTVADE